jgi:hypothetical protein
MGLITVALGTINQQPASPEPGKEVVKEVQCIP